MSAEIPVAPVAGSGLMARLRAETADLHGAAESHPFQKAMVAGRVAPPEFARWVGQMLVIHERLEAHLARLRESAPRLAPVIRDDLFQAARLRSDLARMTGQATEPAPLPATTSFTDRLERLADEHPLGLLGALYVLEGSKNGNRFIARALERAHPGAFALGYLDPHGDAQRELWLRFKLDMDALELDPAVPSGIVEVARETFAAITRLSHDLVATG